MTTVQRPIEHTTRYHTSQTYLLPSDDLEAKRLQEQQDLVVQIFDNRIVIAPVVLDMGSRVLDIGTGSGAWALDLVKYYPNATKAKVSCIDIGPRLFPKEPPSNMNFTTASVLALPTDWENKFNLVHQRLLIAGLKYADWSIAIKEMFRVTAPGGWAQLCEVTPMTTFPSGGPHNDKFSKLVALLTQKIGVDFYCTDRIPALLSEEGFIDVHVERRSIKLGNWGGDLGKKCARNVIGVWRAMKTPIMLSGGFGLVKDEAEFDFLMDEVEKEWEALSGAEMGWFTFIGKKLE